MPIYDLGYRPWDGRLTPAWTRWWAISRSGIGLAFRSKILRRFLFLAIAPLFYFGPLFFAIGYVSDPARISQPGSLGAEFVRGFLGREMAERFISDPASVRPHVWSAIFAFYFAYIQSSLTFFVLAIVGPPLISQDVRSKAFLLYFSKPVTRMEYLLGKGGTALFYVFLVTLLPGLVLYAVSIAFSPSFAVLADTALTVPRIGVASLAVALPPTLVVLAFSSLTSNPRYATFAWIALWLLGNLFVRALKAAPGLRGEGWTFFPSLQEASSIAVGSIFDVASVVEFSEQLSGVGRSQLRMMLESPYSAATAWTYLAAVCAGAFAIIYRRISAPMRI